MATDYTNDRFSIAWDANAGKWMVALMTPFGVSQRPLSDDTYATLSQALDAVFGELTSAKTST